MLILNNIWFYIVVSEIISLVLIFKTWAGNDHKVLKIILSVAILIPFLGPLLYFFVADVPSNSLVPKNNGPRGSYTHGFISMKPLLKKIIKDKDKDKDKDKEKSKESEGKE